MPPITYQKRLPVAQSGSVRGNLDFNDGSGLMGRAMEQAGNQLFKAGLESQTDEEDQR